MVTVAKKILRDLIPLAFKYVSLADNCDALSLMHACLVISDSLQPHGLYSLPGSWVHGIIQTRMLERVAISSSRGSSWPRDQTSISCLAGGFFPCWTIREYNCLLLRPLGWEFRPPLCLFPLFHVTNMLFRKLKMISHEKLWRIIAFKVFIVKKICLVSVLVVALPNLEMFCRHYLNVAISSPSALIQK